MKRGGPQHPKTLALAAALGIERWGAVGIVESLCHFAMQYARRGDIGRHPDAAIAEGIGWRGDIQALVQALVETRWLERCPCHRLRIHDWPHHADQAVNKTRDIVTSGFLECYSIEYPPDSEGISVRTPRPVKVQGKGTGYVRTAKTSESGELAEKYIRVFNESFGRSIRAATPGLPPKIEARIRAGYKPWQILAVPVLLIGSGLPEEMRKRWEPDVPLRDGKHSHTTKDGYTSGATDHLEVRLQAADRTILSPRLTAIADKYGILDELKALGVKATEGVA